MGMQRMIKHQQIRAPGIQQNATSNSKHGPGIALRAQSQLSAGLPYIRFSMMSAMTRRSMTHYFRNLMPGRVGYNTIEFRQHERTLDVEGIPAWIRFTTKTVSCAHYTPNDQYLQLGNEHTDLEES